MLHQSVGDFAGLLVRVPALGHEPDEQREGGGDAEGPAEGPLPFHRLAFRLLEAGHRGQHQDKHHHVVPPGVIYPVEQLEHGIEPGDNRAEEADNQHPPQPVAVLA